MEALEKELSAHGLTVSSTPEKGRCLLTIRDFSPGEVIICQEPYASMPNSPTALRCDRCFTSGNLKKCSSCRMVWYCSSSCQKSEWKLHRLECQALVELGDDRRKMLTPSMRLMVRLILRRKLQSEQVIPTIATDNYDLVEELKDHMAEIGEKKIVLYAQMANLVNLVLPSLEVNIKEVARNFSKLACNAHTICDSELRPLGTGLYPVISIINHSCLPNAVLVFEGRLAVVRAVEPIAKGTEVSISYIETAASTSTRQKALKEQYLFTCMCPRCMKVGLLEDLLESALFEGYRCKDEKCEGILLLDSDKKIFICQQCGLHRTQQEIKKIASDIEQLSNKASSSLSSGSILSYLRISAYRLFMIPHYGTPFINLVLWPVFINVHGSFLNTVRSDVILWVLGRTIVGHLQHGVFFFFLLLPSFPIAISECTHEHFFLVCLHAHAWTFSLSSSYSIFYFFIFCGGGAVLVLTVNYFGTFLE